jgi:signal transduction histidine kinase
MWALILLLLVLAFVLGGLNDPDVSGGEIFLIPLVLIATQTSGTVGAMVASRQPRSPIGWLFLILALCIVVGIHGEDYPIYALRTNPGSLPAAAWVAWLGSWTFALAGAALPLILLLFPTGRVPSPRWRAVPWILVGSALCAIVFLAVQPREMYPTPDLRVENPAGIEALRDIAGPLIAVGTTVALLTAVVCVIGLVVRFRRARGDERQQLRWLAYVGVFALAVLITMFVLDPLTGGGSSGLEDVLWILFVASLTIGIPAACGVALLKYRLYDLDVVIKKTVIFGVLAVFVTLVYVAVVVGVGTVVTGADTGFNVAVFGAIALIALLLQPLRNWARRFADRLVYGKRATPYEVLSEFTERVGETLSVEDALLRMTELITAGTGASRAEVWLRVGDELRLEAISPPRMGDEELRLRLDDAGDPPPIPDATRAIPVRRDDELLGVIAVMVPSSDPLTPEQERLLTELAAQAGLVLRNVRLAAELRARLLELQRSRERLVAAQDEERRKIERNLHDGAQQQLIALAVKARLAEQVADRDPEKSATLLRDIHADAQSALEDLRDLARGIYPPLLADQGLSAALEAQARKSPLAVTVETGAARYPQAVESAVYFCCLEALNNVAKYAEAAHVTVRLSRHDGALRFEIADDGRGFDVNGLTYGTGLQGMADRLDALGGRFDVRSGRGVGTTVAGTIPLPERDASTAVSSDTRGES